MVISHQPQNQAAPEMHADTDTAAECLLAPPVVTDGAARALVIYQRLVESGFNAAQSLNGA